MSQEAKGSAHFPKEVMYFGFNLIIESLLIANLLGGFKVFLV
jgi:hypothetical protein